MSCWTSIASYVPQSTASGDDANAFFQYGSNKSSPQAKDGTAKVSQFDGAADNYALSSVDSSSNSSPITMAPTTQKRLVAAHNGRVSPAPLTGFATGMSISMYQRPEYPWNQAHSPTAITG